MNVITDLSDLIPEMAGQTISIKVKAIGDGWTYSNSNFATLNIVQTQLPAPTITQQVSSLTDIIKWNAVSGADRYNIYDGDEYLTQVTTTQINLSSYREQLMSGHMYVTALGRFHFESTKADGGQFERYVTPTITISRNMVYCSGATGASSYSVYYTDGETYTLLGTSESSTIDLCDYLDDLPLQTGVCVRANPDPSETGKMPSEFSNTVTINRIATSASFDFSVTYDKRDGHETWAQRGTIYAAVGDEKFTVTSSGTLSEDLNLKMYYWRNNDWQYADTVWLTGGSSIYSWLDEWEGHESFVSILPQESSTLIKFVPETMDGWLIYPTVAKTVTFDRQLATPIPYADGHGGYDLRGAPSEQGYQYPSCYKVWYKDSNGNWQTFCNSYYKYYGTTFDDGFVKFTVSQPHTITARSQGLKFLTEAAGETETVYYASYFSTVLKTVVQAKGLTLPVQMKATQYDPNGWLQESNECFFTINQ